MSKFYYLYPEKHVNKVYAEVIDYGVDDTLYIQVVWNLYEEGKTEIHYSEDMDSIDEALELLAEIEEELRWYYRDKALPAELEKVIYPYELDDLIDDFSEDELEDEDEICWECIKGTCNIH